jgi:septum formation protein
MDFILASSSPRRRELLNLVGIEPVVIFPDTREQMIDGESLGNFLKRVTDEKARSVYQSTFFDAVVMSADTIVLVNDNVLGKPRNRDHARLMLESLSDRMHEVWTGISVLYRGKARFDCARTKVYFEKISEPEIERYLNHETYQDKAGAYAIQGRASVFVRKINGCYFNVMGLPLHVMMQMLKKMGIHQYL